MAADERPFIAPKPMEPPSQSAALARPDPFAEAAVANGLRPFGKRRAAPSLFERITRGRPRQGETEGEAEPAPPTLNPRPARASEPEQAAAPEKEPEAAEAPAAQEPEKDLVAPAPDDDLLDIPAFLRRQAN